MTEPATRFTLRQLPLPAKLVLTLFLLTVGLGYSSAMVQLHFQHTKANGEPMPMVEDVVEIFAGKKKATAADVQQQPVSKLEKLVMGPLQGPFNGSGTMAPAFFDRCPIYKAAVTGGRERRTPISPADKEKLDAEREGERKVFQAWINTPDAERKAAYESDKFTIPAEKAPKSITPLFVHDGNAGYKVKSIIDTRCATCHKKGEAQEQFPLETYDQLAAYMEVPTQAVVQEGEWCPSDRQVSKEKLTQSTHAHLLSFAMLFTLTGLIFAFTSYPLSVRCILGPLVLVAQVADVSCWWLARLDGPGPYFAMAIIGTGGLVGLGLFFQIVLSTFNMYGMKGKLVVAAIFGLGLVLGGLAYVKVIRPHLEEERKQAAEKAKESEQPADPTPPPNNNGSNNNGTPPVVTGPSRLEHLLTGPYVPKGPFSGKAQGGMVRAFFNKAEDFEEAMLPEREGEQAVVLAWIKTTPEVRKKAYEEDRFPLPAELAGKPLTAAFKADDKTVKVKSVIDARCAICHSKEGDQADHPLQNYEQILRYLGPAPSTPKADNGSPKAPAVVANPKLPDPKAPAVVANPKPPEPKVPATLGASRMEKALTGPFSPEGPWGAEDGGMVRAFFDKESDFKKKLKKKDEEPEEYKALFDEREGERAAVLAWAKAAPEVRKKAYEADKFELPAELRGKPLTPEFKVDDKTFAVRTLFEARCLSCHTEGSKAPSFETFAEVEKFLAPEPAKPQPPAKAEPAEAKPVEAKPAEAKPNNPTPPAEPKERPAPPTAAPDLPVAPSPRPAGKPPE